MYVDNLGLLSDAQAFTGAATFSQNAIDLGASTPKREIGTGEPVGIGIAVDVAAGAGSTVTIDVVQSDNADLSTPDVIATQSGLAATFPVGNLRFIAIPVGFPTKRYLGIRETSAGGTTTITLTAWLTAQKMFSASAKAYAKNYAV